MAYNNFIKSFIAYFYDGDKLTDNGVDLFAICGDRLLIELDGASTKCYDPENEGVKMLEGKICKTVIETSDGSTHIFDKSKISVFQIEYTEKNFAARLVERYGAMPHFKITTL